VRRLQRGAQEAQLREVTKNIENAFARKDVGGVALQTAKISKATPDMLREVGDRAKKKHSPTVVVMSSVNEEEGSCQLVVMADDAAVKKGVNAGALVKEASALLGGRGGGRPNTAQGGGKNIDSLDGALKKIEEILTEQVKG
jgi:alanyl-tRNA synthetase